MIYYPFGSSKLKVQSLNNYPRSHTVAMKFTKGLFTVSLSICLLLVPILGAVSRDEVLVHQKPIASMDSTENVIEQEANVHRKRLLRLHLGLFGAVVDGEAGYGGIGGGSEFGVSYTKPTYAVGVEARRTVATFLLLTNIDMLSVSIGGRACLNTNVSPYIGGGLSINYAKGVVIFEEVENLVVPGVYGVVGIEVQHFSKHRLKLELRVDRMLEVRSITFGASYSITI